MLNEPMQRDSMQTGSSQAESALWGPFFDSRSAPLVPRRPGSLRNLRDFKRPSAPLQTRGIRPRGPSGALHFGNTAASKTATYLGVQPHPGNCQGAQGPGTARAPGPQCPKADKPWCLSPDCPRVLSPHTKLPVVISLSASCTQLPLTNLCRDPPSSPQFATTGNHGFWTLPNSVPRHAPSLPLRC